jgi:hypothetical protein
LVKVRQILDVHEDAMRARAFMDRPLERVAFEPALSICAILRVLADSIPHKTDEK